MDPVNNTAPSTPDAAAAVRRRRFSASAADAASYQRARAGT